MIYPINPFGENDSYVVDDGVAYKEGKNHISDLLRKYGLVKIAGTGLRYINLGVIVKLDEICAIPFEDFKVDDKLSVNGIVENWLTCCDDKQKCFDEFFKVFENQIKYIYDPNTLIEKKYDGEYLLPLKISEEILKKIDLDEKNYLLNIEKCNLKTDYLQDEKIITNSSGVELNDYKMEDISGEDVDGRDRDFFALIDDSKKILYVGAQVNYYCLMLNKIRQINSAVLSDKDIKIIREGDIQSVSKQMMCFQDAYSDVHPGIPIESVARYRILNHLIFLMNTSKVDIKEWMGLIKKHEIVNFPIIKKNNPIKEEDGVLYVPKDRSRAQSTLKYIYEKYCRNSVKRSSIDIYDQLITKNGSCYYTGGKKIERVVLLFDNIQNGTSTKGIIDQYIRKKSTKPSDKIMTFQCDGKEIFLSEILKENKCRVEIFSVYASEIGISNVKSHVTANYPGMDIQILDPIKKLTAIATEDDIDLMKKIYPKRLAGKIYKGCYLIIREFNQPKLNIMCDKLLEIERVVSLFCKRTEL